jgi:hypothetical protein
MIRSEAQGNGGALPARWDASVAGNFPKRAICSGDLCTK